MNMRGKLFFIAAIVFLLLHAVPSLAAEPVAAAPHPNIILTNDDIDRIKTNIAEVEWAKTYHDGMRAWVEEWIAKGPDIPEKGGGWSQNYVSPESGRSLVYNRAEPHRHLDPGTGKYLEGEVYDASWRDIAHYENIQTALQAGLLYQLTGDNRYAEFARAMLAGYAKKYAGFAPHGGPAGLGRITAQSLDEARWLVSAAGTFDLVADAPCMTEKDRKGIIERLLIPAAEHVRLYKFGVHNIQVWHDVAMLMAGLIAEDKGLAAYAAGDLRKQMKEGIRAEGMWYETSVGYHFFATKPFETLLAICRNQKLDLCEAPELKNLFTAMPKLVMPDGNMPALNDAVRGRDVLESLRGLVGARRSFGDSSLDSIIVTLGNKRNWKDELPGFMYYIKPESPPPEWEYPTTSEHMPDAGITVLRRGGRYALLKYNPYCGGHDHPDKLGIIYYAGGREVFPSRGTIFYSHPLYRDWYRKTEAHNTLTVDGRQQHKAVCRALDFTDTAAATGVTARCEGISDGVAAARALVLTDDALVDVLWTESDEGHTYDWFLHAAAPPPDAPATEEKTPNPEMAFTAVAEAAAGRDKTFRWQAAEHGGEEAFTRLTALSPGRVYEGAATGFLPGEKLPFLMWRQEGKRALFIAVTTIGHEPEATAEAEKEVVRIRMGKSVITINMDSGGIEVR